MKTENKLKNQWRRMALMAGILTISVSSLNAQTQERQQQNKNIVSKVYFSPKQIASSLADAEINNEKTIAFIDAYMMQLDTKGQISPQGMMTAFKKAGFSTDEAKKVTNSLLENRNQSNGYGIENYAISFSINENGELTNLLIKGKKSYSEKDIDEIHQARCRHLGIAVDDDKNRFEASDFVTYMLVRDIVLKRQNTDTAIPNSAAFLKKFEKKLSKNGLEIGFDGKLHGVEASKNKPLLTKKELFNQYLQNRRTEINNLRR